MDINLLSNLFDDSFNKKFKHIKKIGKGVFGNVHKMLNRENQQIVAVKKYRYQGDIEEMKMNAIAEINFLKQLSGHPNIIQLYEIIENETMIGISLEIMDMNLKELLMRSSEQLTDNLITSYSYQLLLGIEFCHTNNIIHLDLKPQNILIDKSRCLKIADFGSAKKITHIPSNRFFNTVCSLWYRDPEILLGQKKYSYHHDMWSIGCIISEMITKYILFCGETEKEQLDLIFQLLGTPCVDSLNTNKFVHTEPNLYWSEMINLSKYKSYFINDNTFPKWRKKNLGEYYFKKYKININSDIIDLIQQFLIYDPRKRSSASSGLKHKCFNNINGLKI